MASNKMIDWGESAATGDTDAWKKILAVVVILVGVFAFVIATIGVAVMNIGEDVRGAVGDALSNSKESVQKNSVSTQVEAPY